MSKITLHWQGVESWYSAFLARAGATHAKGIGNYPTFPGVETIGRAYYNQANVNYLVTQGADGANAMWTAVRSEVLANPQITLWETPANEASIWLHTVAAGYIAFNQRLIDIFHANGLRIIVGAVNTGWPRLPSEDGGAMARLLAEACYRADGVSFHEYGWNDMRQGAGYNCLRYRHWHDWCEANGFQHPPIYITECGLDRTEPPGPDFGHAGWRVVLNGDEDAYIEQLAWYESELQADDYVCCATVFTSGPSGWESFDLYEEVAMKLADEIRDVQPPEPPPEPGPVRYYDRDGVERDEAWWRSIYGEGARVEAGDGDLRIVELHDSGEPTGMDFQVHGVPQSVVPILRNGGTTGLQWKDERGGYWEGLVWACYAPPYVGAYDLQVPGGDSLLDFGWLCETEHRHPKRVVYAAGTPPPPETYTLTVEVVGQGEVVVTPPGPYAPGATVTLTAYRASGWAFAGWSGDLTGTVNPAELVMDGDKAVTATFEESPDPVQALIDEARALLALADAKLIEAIGLLP